MPGTFNYPAEISGPLRRKAREILPRRNGSGATARPHTRLRSPMQFSPMYLVITERDGNAVMYRRPAVDATNSSASS